MRVFRPLVVALLHAADDLLDEAEVLEGLDVRGDGEVLDLGSKRGLQCNFNSSV